MCDIDKISESARQALTEVRLSLTKVGSRLSGRKESTKNIKTALCKAGRSLGFRTAAQDVDKTVKDEGEWLFDVVWMSLAWEPRRQLKRIHLVVESEWGNQGDIRDDFEKLLVARSDVRLMIFQASNKAEVKEVFNLLQGEAEGFEQRQAGDYYLLAGYDLRNAIFRWREFQVEP